MNRRPGKHLWMMAGLGLMRVGGVLVAQKSEKKPSRLALVGVHEESASIRARMKAAKPWEEVCNREGSLLGVCQ